MNTHSMCFSGLLRTTALVSVLTLASSYTSIAIAAQGCGHGFHRNYYGQCVYNHHRWGHHYYYRNCWRNAWGQIRCYRYY